MKANNLFKDCGIYAIENLINGRIYIGSTNDFIRRFRDHRATLDRGVHKNKFLQNDFNKCGSDAFQFSIIFITSLEEMYSVEEEWLERLWDGGKQCYNIMKTTVPLRTCFSKTPEETRAKMSNSQKGKKLTEIHKQRIGLKNKGRIVSQEVGKKISEAKQGHGKGRVHSEETKRKMSQWQKGIPKSEEMKEKRRLTMLAKKQASALPKDIF